MRAKRPLVNNRLGEVLRYVVALDRTLSADERSRWRRRFIVDRVVLGRDFRFIVNLATTTKVEAIDAGTEMSAIGLGTGKCEHTNTCLTGPARYARQVSDISRGP